MLNRKVRFTNSSQEQVNWGGNDDPEQFLQMGQVYTLISEEVHSWHTKYILAECPDKKFNSTSFEAVLAERTSPAESAQPAEPAGLVKPCKKCGSVDPTFRPFDPNLCGPCFNGPANEDELVRKMLFAFRDVEAPDEISMSAAYQIAREYCLKEMLSDPTHEECRQTATDYWSGHAKSALTNFLASRRARLGRKKEPSLQDRVEDLLTSPVKDPQELAAEIIALVQAEKEPRQ